MDKKSAQEKAEIIEITPEILEEKIESIKKRPKRTLENELLSRLSFAWLSCITAMWGVFSAIELVWGFANVVFNLFKSPESNKRFINSLKGVRLPIGFCLSSIVGVVVPGLGSKLIRRMDRMGAVYKSPVYAIIRMMFAKYL